MLNHITRVFTKTGKTNEKVKKTEMQFKHDLSITFLNSLRLGSFAGETSANVTSDNVCTDHRRLKLIKTRLL